MPSHSRFMYTIEVTMKGSAAPIAVQLKEEANAEKIYAQVVDAIAKGEPSLLALNCDRTDKKATVLVQEIAAVQIVPKQSSTTGQGSRPGFFAQLDSE